MIHTIVSHDVVKGEAIISFDYKNVKFVQTYKLIHVEPSTQHIFNTMGIDFDLSYQNKAINILVERIKNQIDSGAIFFPEESSENTLPSDPPEG